MKKDCRYQIEYTPKTKLEDFFQNPLYIELYNGSAKFHSYKINYIESTDSETKILEKFNQLNYDYEYFLFYKDNYEAIRQYFKPPFDFDSISYLIYNTDLELNALSKKAVEYLLDKSNCEWLVSVYFSKKQYKEFEELYSSKNTKSKLNKLIFFDCDFSDNAKSKKNELIEKLEKLDSVGLLPDDSETVFNKIQQSAGKFRLSKGRKTDFIKILNSMYECRFFETENGFLASNKQEIFNEFGQLLDEDFSKYSAMLTQSKQGEYSNFIKTFKELEKKADEYYNKEYQK